MPQGLSLKVGPFVLTRLQEGGSILDKTVLTVTMNPAIDIQCVVPDFSPGRWFRASEVDRSAGGKGVRVENALQVRNGIRGRSMIE